MTASRSRTLTALRLGVAGLEGCRGFRVDCAEEEVGTVVEVVYGASHGVASGIVVRPARSVPHLLLVPAEEVASVSIARKRVILQRSWGRAAGELPARLLSRRRDPSPMR